MGMGIAFTWNCICKVELLQFIAGNVSGKFVIYVLVLRIQNTFVQLEYVYFFKV